MFIISIIVIIIIIIIIIIQMKAISSTFEPVLFIMLCRVELPFESMDAILMSDQLK